MRVEGVSGEQAHALLREELVALIGPDLDRSLHADRTGSQPAVMMVVGVNGVGKTTTVGKIARVLVAEDKDVILGGRRHVPSRGRRPAHDLGRPGRSADRPGAGGIRPGERRIRGGQGGRRARGRHRHHRHRRPPSHEGRTDGRAGQGQARRREAGAGRRGAAGHRRHDRSERAHPGPRVRRGRRRDRHRA